MIFQGDWIQFLARVEVLLFTSNRLSVSPPGMWM